MEIVSGLGEKPHVTSQQFRQILEGTIGQKSYIVTSGENLEPELAANNLLKIRSGMMSHHGNVSSVKIGTYDEVELTNGSQGMKRIDLVVNRYTRNAETNIEKNEWVVIMGTPVASNPVAPAYTVGNLQKGDLVDDCPVFELHYDGINVTEVKKMLSVLPNVAELNSKMMADDYAVIDLSGWIFSYKQLGNNLLWFNIAQNINNQSASNRRDQGVKIPFTLPFDQHSFGHINVAGYPVGEDIFSFYKDGSVWMGSTGYNGYATYHASGILVIN